MFFGDQEFCILCCVWWQYSLSDTAYVLLYWLHPALQSIGQDHNNRRELNETVLSVSFGYILHCSVSTKNHEAKWYIYISTVTCHLMMGICSEKCIVRWFRCCANVIECTYINLDSTAYYTPRLYGIAYCS